MININQNGEVYEVSFPYDPFVVDLVKNVPGRRWLATSKIWTIPKDKLGFLLAQFKGTVYETAVKIISEEQINENATLDVTTVIPNIDISQIPLYVKEGSQIYPHQVEFMKYSIFRELKGNMNGFICADDQGCISGDAMISVNIRKSGEKMQLRKLYRHWKDHPDWHKDGWSYKARCLHEDEEVFRLNHIEDVVYSGQKPVYQVKLSDGYSVKATSDHLILTDTGYRELQSLVVGDIVITNGQTVCRRCGALGHVTSSEATYPGVCRKCAYQLRNEKFSKDYIEKIDEDGYHLIRGKRIASWHTFNASGYIYLHRYIMEEHIGRPLMSDEVVHHIDGNPHNNTIENLVLTNVHDHTRIYHDSLQKFLSKDYTSKSGSMVIVKPKKQTVISIEYVGIEDTYDIKMLGPHHNFIADGVVVHNCGKSLEAMNLAIYNKNQFRFQHCLVICCINSSKYNWVNDIKMHTRGEYVPYILGSRMKKHRQSYQVAGGKEKLDDLMNLKQFGSKKGKDLPYFIILNVEAIRYKEGRKYPIADRLIELINKKYIGMIVIDEVHKNLSPTSQQGKQLLRIKKSITETPMWIPMSGTPITKRPTDLFLPLLLVNAHGYNSFYTWSKEYCIYGGFGGHEVVGYKNVPRLKSQLQANMIRRLKSDVLDLPPKIQYTEYVDNTLYQERLYDRTAAGLLREQEEIVKSLNPLSKFLRLRQVNGNPELVDPSCDITDSRYIEKNAKLQRLMELLEEIHERGEKVVIFSNWVESLRTLYKFVSSKYKTCCFTGTMKETDRQKHKEVFINNPNYTVMMGTFGALGTTHTLTVARNVIMYDEPWNPSDKVQAEDRCYRIGTNESVNIYTIITRDTVDDRVHDILYTKAGISEFIVDNKLDITNNPRLFNLLLSDTIKNIRGDLEYEDYSD